MKVREGLLPDYFVKVNFIGRIEDFQKLYARFLTINLFLLNPFQMKSPKNCYMLSSLLYQLLR